jgi:regulation of enolase protein 1 (concanavalin A-like superfamily)
MTPFTLPGIPGTLHWMNEPLSWQNNSELVITAGKKTDLFTNPNGGSVAANVPAAFFDPGSDNFMLSANIRVDFASTFDAGTLLIYAGPDQWGKLAFEYSPYREPMVVSVITRRFSDDCNSAVINGQAVYLRIARIAPAFAFHYSTDGKFWHLVRHFALDNTDGLQVGFSAQAPTGDQCRATFSEIIFRQDTLKDIRSGE